MVEFQREGGVARIFLNRPQKVNALDSATLDALADALQKVDEDIRVVVLGGHGKAFCAGADVNELRSLDPQTAREFIGRVHRACHAVRTLPMPVVARLHGAVIGAGLELAAACDLRVAATGTRFAMPEVRLGIPSVVEAALLPRLMGSGRAAWLVLTGEAIDAERARQWGLVESVADDVDRAVSQVVDSLLAGDAAALRTQKALLQMWEEQPLAASVAASIERFGQAYTIPRAKATKEH
jgi:enoyl-CoA hydratase/carnithine racemase